MAGKVRKKLRLSHRLDQRVDGGAAADPAQRLDRRHGDVVVGVAAEGDQRRDADAVRRRPRIWATSASTGGGAPGISAISAGRRRR